jgi:hypothetical protein
MSLWSRIKYSFHRKRLDDEIEEELISHMA